MGIRLYIGILFLFTNILYNKPPALENIHGASCYINATLQCLNNLTDFSQHLYPYANTNRLPPMAQHVIDVLQQMKTESTITHDTLYNTWRAIQRRMNPSGTGNNHEDACHFLNTFIDTLTTDVQQRYYDLFGCTEARSRMLHHALLSSSKAQETELPLCVLPAESHVNLSHLIQQRYKQQALTYNLSRDQLDKHQMNTLYHENLHSLLNSTVTLTETPALEQTGKYLTITVTTLNHTNPTIDIPETLTITKNDAHKGIPVLSDDAQCKKKHYRLNSIIVHSGNTRCGHYWAYVNNNGTWWYCNDSTVYKQRPPMRWKGKTGFPYILFYEESDEATNSPSPPVYTYLPNTVTYSLDVLWPYMPSVQQLCAYSFIACIIAFRVHLQSHYPEE